MAPLKARTVTRQEVDASDLDAFVKEVTGRDWEFVAAEAASNDSDHAFRVSSKPLDQYSQGKIDGFLAGDVGSYPYAQIMLDWLALQGHILPGNYLVKVCW